MKILILGGTIFLEPHTVEVALARARGEARQVRRLPARQRRGQRPLIFDLFPKAVTEEKTDTRTIGLDPSSNLQTHVSSVAP